MSPSTFPSTSRRTARTSTRARWVTPTASLLGLSMLVAACGGDDAADDAAGDGAAAEGGNPPVELRVAHAQAPDHPFQVCGLEPMQEELAANTEANLTLEIFGGAQLGSNEQTMETVQAGNLEMTMPGLGSLSIFEPRIGALEAAFAFEDFEHVQEVVNGEIGEELIVPLRESANTRILGPLWLLGSRHVTANEPITSPDDLAGKTIRSQDTPASLATGAALGGTPTPINFSELYLALSQGVVDAQENPLVQIDSADLHEVQDYVSLTGHVVNVTVLLIGEGVYQSLTDEQLEVLEEAAANAAERNNECIGEYEEEILATWAAEDPPAMTVIEQDELDMEAFRANAERVYTEDPEYANLWGDVYERILETR